MKVAVIGAGAVGIGLASCLAGAGVRIHLVVRSARQRDLLREKGITRSGIFGRVAIPGREFSVADSLDSLASAECDVWLVCVKSHASRPVARLLAPIWRERDEADRVPRVVLCQNGWGNAEIFAEFIPRDAIFNARVITGFVRSDPSHADVTVHADAIRVGSLFGADASPLEPLCEAIGRGGIPCELSSEIEKDLWAKLLYNSLLNPLGALVGVPYGELGERPETRAIMRAVAEEIFAVLSTSGHRTHWRSADDYLETFYSKLLPPTARHRSSMLQDLQAGLPTEIDSICGAVCELAEQHGIETPSNTALLALIRVAQAKVTS